MSQLHQQEETKLAGQAVAGIEIIEIEVYAKECKPVPKAKHYRIRVDKERFVVRESAITGEEILALVDKKPGLYHLYQHIRGGQAKIVKPNDLVDLTAPGVERFSTIKIENTEGAIVRP